MHFFEVAGHNIKCVIILYLVHAKVKNVFPLFVVGPLFILRLKISYQVSTAHNHHTISCASFEKTRGTMIAREV